MKKVNILFLSLLAVLFLGITFQSCNNGKTYSEMVDEEREAIARFISINEINRIGFNEFSQQDSMTNLDQNQYVRLSEDVLMQIRKKGEGRKIQDGDQILVRAVEYDILDEDTTYITTLIDEYVPVPNGWGMIDEIRYEKGSNNSVIASFINNLGAMYLTYGANVPQAWIMPLDFINLGRNTDDLARVRLIVPHKAGTNDAVGNVHPFYYEITYQLSR